MTRQEDLYKLAKTDPLSFIEQTFVIRPDVGGHYVPFRLRPIQRRFLESMVGGAKRGPRWVICAKARRLGLTSATQALAALYMLRQPNYRVALLAQLKTPGQTVMGYVSDFWAGVEEQIGSILACSDLRCQHRNLRCAFVEKTKDSWEFRWGSKIQVFTAETKYSARAAGFQFLHLTEAAYYGSSEEEVIDSILPTLPKSKDADDCFIIAESTGSGNSGWFYETYQIAKEAEKARQMGRRTDVLWEPIFYPWFEDLRYRREDLLVDGKLEPDPDFDDEEEHLRRRFNLDDAQLAWRRMVIRSDFAGNTERFKREYPSSDEEAFLVKGAGVFPTDVLVEMRDIGEKLVRVGHLRNVSGETRFVEDPQKGVIRIVRPPKPGAYYLIAADPALGVQDTAVTKAGDYSGAVVYGRDGTKIEQVAALRVRVDVEHFTELVLKLAHWYNTAEICPERNSGTGRHMIRLLRNRNYPRIWRSKDVSRLEIDIEDVLGWQTSAVSKQMMISDMQAALAARAVVLYDPEIIDELLSYSRHPAGSRERYGPSSPSGHDDMADAAMIGLSAWLDNPPASRRTGHYRSSTWDRILRDLAEIRV